MHFERLRTCDQAAFNKAMALYAIGFPLHEQRLPESQAQIMALEEYQFLSIYDGAEWVGILLCWETARFCYVEHFCIDPAKRNKRYGQRALELLTRRGKLVILEIDPPVDEIAIRRKGFYRRAGFAENGFDHVHPPYRAGYGGHRLVVLSHPRPLSQAEYAAFNCYLQGVVMGV